MPLFEFKNHDTGEEFELFISGAEKDVYLTENPHITQLLDAPMISMDSRRFMGLRKVDQGWKDVLRKIDSRAPCSELSKTSSVGF